MSSVPTIKRWKNNYHRQNKEGIINVQERGNKSGTSTAATKAMAGVANLKPAPLVGNQNQQNKKSKFLLGGNIRDPLNLNSLSDERVSRMVNAVTPESSPIPTPKHRKAEYKIEVLIPPNISDPLNLMNADQIEGEYESQLLSPVLAAGRRKKAVDTQGQALGGTVGGGSSTGGVTTSNSGAPLCGINPHNGSSQPFFNSCLATALKWTSSGPSASLRALAQANISARGKSEESPPAPCAWMARSRTAWAMLGATTLIMAISGAAQVWSLS